MPSSSSTRSSKHCTDASPGRGLVHHSDQGSQYVSLAFGRRCRQAGIEQSMGGRRSAYDNAVCESFFKTLKSDLVDRRSWPTKPRAAHRRLRLHRVLLQPATTPLKPRLPLTSRIREDHRRKQKRPNDPVSTEPGELHTTTREGRTAHSETGPRSVALTTSVGRTTSASAGICADASASPARDPRLIQTQRSRRRDR